MCGIAGIWGCTDENLVQGMIEKIAHRGPDGVGFHVNGNSALQLGHSRLAIMDPMGGAQPIYNEDKSLVLIANSEIYNFPQLRAELMARHQFATKSDCEAILHLYEEAGAAASVELDGMFAVAVSNDESLFLARDPIGIKPLYYSQKTGEDGEDIFYFASELKAMTDWTDTVHEFPPGTYYDSDTGFVSYYEVPDLSPQTLSIDEHLRRVRNTLEEAVVKRLMSDVPLGAFLSGGLDSSIIAALARQHMDELHTFSVGVEGSPDIEAARKVAAHIGSIHHEYLYTAEDVTNCLPEVIYHLESFDRDLVRSAIPCYLCARLASDYVKVILTGEGADELFAGYTYYKDIQQPDVLHRELRRSVANLHNMNLQRVDRLTMCHKIEGRVPFLDTTLIEVAQTIPPELKLRQAPDGRRVEKWILRKACEDLLPDEIVWRDKEQFDEGSGTVDLLAESLQSVAATIDAASYRAQYPEHNLRSAEECYYHMLLNQAFSNPQVVLDNVAQWSTERLG